MLTGPIVIFLQHQWGHERHTNPDSVRGILTTWARQKFRTLCKQHGLQSVKDCTSIHQFETKSVYDCLLACECRKIVEVAVSRTPSGRKKLAEEKERAREFEERQSLLDQMGEAGTL